MGVFKRLLKMVDVSSGVEITSARQLLGIHDARHGVRRRWLIRTSEHEYAWGESDGTPPLHQQNGWGWCFPNRTGDILCCCVSPEIATVLLRGHSIPVGEFINLTELQLFESERMEAELCYLRSDAASLFNGNSDGEN